MEVTGIEISLVLAFENHLSCIVALAHKLPESRMRAIGRNPITSDDTINLARLLLNIGECTEEAKFDNFTYDMLKLARAFSASGQSLKVFVQNS